MNRDHQCKIRGSALVIAICFTFLTLALWLAMLFPPAAASIQSIDDYWHNLMAQWEWQPMVKLATAAAIFGGIWVTVPIQVLIGGWLWKNKNWLGLRMWLFAVIPTHVAVGITKFTYVRPRPADRLYDITTPSFPSGHSADAAVIAVTLTFILIYTRDSRYRWLWLAAVYAVTMAWTRTYLRVHWASDVTAGLLLGTCCALWAAVLVSCDKDASPGTNDNTAPHIEVKSGSQNTSSS